MLKNFISAPAGFDGLISYSQMIMILMLILMTSRMKRMRIMRMRISSFCKGGVEYRWGKMLIFVNI